jgi:hypothetical protein
MTQIQERALINIVSYIVSAIIWCLLSTFILHQDILSTMIGGAIFSVSYATSVIIGGAMLRRKRGKERATHVKANH